MAKNIKEIQDIFSQLQNPNISPQKREQLNKKAHKAVDKLDDESKAYLKKTIANFETTMSALESRLDKTDAANAAFLRPSHAFDLNADDADAATELQARLRAESNAEKNNNAKNKRNVTSHTNNQNTRRWDQSGDPADLSKYHPPGYLSANEEEQAERDAEQLMISSGAPPIEEINDLENKLQALSEEERKANEKKSLQTETASEQEKDELSRGKPSLNSIDALQQQLLTIQEEEIKACEQKKTGIANAINQIPLEPSVYPTIHPAQNAESLYRNISPPEPAQHNTALISTQTDNTSKTEQRAEKALKAAQDCFDEVSLQQKKLGSQYRAKKNQNIAIAITETLQTLSNIKKIITDFCLNPIKALKNFFGSEKESAMSKLSETTTKMEAIQTNMINKQQDVEKKFQEKIKAFKHIPESQKKFQLKQLNLLKKQMESYKKNTELTNPLIKLYKQKMQKLSKNNTQENKVAPGRH